MGVLCILLDKERQYAPVLADIFDITGHRLLVALDEDRALELLSQSEPEVILLSEEDMSFWFKLLGLGKYVAPLLFLKSYEGTESLRKYGLRDDNFVVLPFNPMELLTKIVSLSREPQHAASLSSMGPMNALLKLLRKGVTSSLLIQYGGISCSLCLREGVVTGSSCSPERLLALLSEDVDIRLDTCEDRKAVMDFSYKNTRDFLFSLFYGYMQGQTPSRKESGAERPPPSKPPSDLNRPIKIDGGLFWIGVPREGGLFQKNSYLRVYERDSIRVPVLINTGTMQDYPLIRSKLEGVIGTVEALKAVVLLGSGVDECSGVVNLLQSNQRLSVITSMSIAQRLKALGIPGKRIRSFETFPDGRLRLATGDSLRFIPLPFLPERGSFAMLEEGKGYLFTGRFLSSLCTYERLDPKGGGDVEEVFLYTNFITPSQDILKRALKRLGRLGIGVILPMFGNPLYSEERVRELFLRLEMSPLFLNPEVEDREVILEVCNSLIGYLREHFEASELEAFLEEFSQFARLEGGRILEFLVEPESIPSLMLSLMDAGGLKPAIVEQTMKHFLMAGLPITI